MGNVDNTCVYCGELCTEITRDHVFPRSLYPPSNKPTRANRLTVPSCKTCNNFFSKDEDHFRTVILLAGKSSSITSGIWHDKVLRSWNHPRGTRLIKQLWDVIERCEVDGADRPRIYPARDERVLRIIRKSVRALSHIHQLHANLSDTQVWVDVLRFALPEDVQEKVAFIGDEPEIVEYCHIEYTFEEIRSLWLIRFFGQATFLATVSGEIVHPAIKQMDLKE